MTDVNVMIVNVQQDHVNVMNNHGHKDIFHNRNSRYLSLLFFLYVII